MRSLVGCLTLILAALPVMAQTLPLNPRKPTGFSTIEQRYVYAPPDEGHFEFPLFPGSGTTGELLIEEPEMCNGSASARVDYSKSEGTVRVRVHYDGLPYRMSAAFQEDRSTPWNQFPVSVTEGKWQIWFVGHIFDKYSIFYYDALTGILIGNEYDVEVEDLPPSAIPVVLPVLHMMQLTPHFESDPNTLVADVDITKDYHQLLDAEGSGGVFVAYIPKQLCKPDELTLYYTDNGLPVDIAMDWDNILDSIHAGYGFALATSLEPDPKPAYLKSRDNIMIGWGGGYPFNVPDGYTSNTLTGALSLRETCETHEALRFPPSIYDFCGPVE